MYWINTTPEGEPNVWIELTATKLAPVAPAKPDYWWRNTFTMLRRNGYNESLMDRFDRICKKPTLPPANWRELLREALAEAKKAA